MRHSFLRPGLAIALACAFASAHAAPSAEQISRLSRDLTPFGAEKAGNKDGTIPPWTGGITKPPAGYAPGTQHPDPFAGDKPRFTIDSTNLDKHRDRLSVGVQKLLEAYPSYRLPVYQTRRSASAPARIYEATARAAATARLDDGGNGVGGAVIGIPFPIPENGLQVLWNHMLRYRGEEVTRTLGQTAVTRGGDYTLVKLLDRVIFHYSLPGMTEAKLDNKILYFKQTVAAPPRAAGAIVLAHETINQVKEPRRAWVYNPGQRRVRRAPNVGYDNPGTAADGLRTADQYDMFNGAPNRYDWKLVGKREIYVPYNSYRLHSSKLKVSDIIRPLHINPEHVRYELHRVWVVEARLKEGARHLYKRRTFYVDEDSWQILLADLYDNRDELWRVSEGHVINYYEKPLLWTTLEVHSDLQSGRYLAVGVDNEYPPYDFSYRGRTREFQPAALRREGRK